MSVGAAGATTQSKTQASNGWLAVVQGVFDKGTDKLFEAGQEYLKDQWGLKNKGNTVDQNMYNPISSQVNQGNTAITQQPQNVGLVDVNLGPNAIIAMLVGGAVLYFAFMR